MMPKNNETRNPPIQNFILVWAEEAKSPPNALDDTKAFAQALRRLNYNNASLQTIRQERCRGLYPIRQVFIDRRPRQYMIAKYKAVVARQTNHRCPIFNHVTF